jgi:phage-related minor tail protein
MLGYDAAQPPSPPQYAGLAAWLQAEHLTDGLSGYHQANIATLESGGKVTLRAVRPTPGGRIGAYTWNASAAWFDPVGHTANFLVLTASGAPAAAAGAGLTVAEATATFGRPARTHRYGEYVILVWPRDENLLDRLR